MDNDAFRGDKFTNRELDWEVAKRKDWTITEEPASDKYPKLVHRLRNPDGEIQETRSNADPAGFTSIPGYTTNIRSAWELLLELEDAPNRQGHIALTYGNCAWPDNMVMNVIHWLEEYENINLPLSYRKFVEEYYPEDLGLPPRNK